MLHCAFSLQHFEYTRRICCARLGQQNRFCRKLRKDLYRFYSLFHGRTPLPLSSEVCNITFYLIQSHFITKLIVLVRQCGVNQRGKAIIFYQFWAHAILVKLIRWFSSVCVFAKESSFWNALGWNQYRIVTSNAFLLWFSWRFKSLETFFLNNELEFSEA